MNPKLQASYLGLQPHLDWQTRVIINNPISMPSPSSHESSLIQLSLLLFNPVVVKKKKKKKPNSIGRQWKLMVITSWNMWTNGTLMVIFWIRKLKNCFGRMCWYMLLVVRRKRGILMRISSSMCRTCLFSPPPPLPHSTPFSNRYTYSCNRVVCTSSHHRSSSELSSPNSNETLKSDYSEVISQSAWLGTSVAVVPPSTSPNSSKTTIQHYIPPPLGLTQHLTKTPIHHPPPPPPSLQTLGYPSYNPPWFILTIIFASCRERSASMHPILGIPLLVLLLERSWRMRSWLMGRCLFELQDWLWLGWGGLGKGNRLGKGRGIEEGFSKRSERFTNFMRFFFWNLWYFFAKGMNEFQKDNKELYFHVTIILHIEIKALFFSFLSPLRCVVDFFNPIALQCPWIFMLTTSRVFRTTHFVS